MQAGCEERYTYCIIPQTRGRGRSRPIAEVLAQVEQAKRAGFKELVLCGVHLGSYGCDLRSAVHLIDLLRSLDRQDGECLFRISSLEPMDCVPEIVDLVERSGRFAPPFHLPLQHASDVLLRGMGRPYTLATYRRIVDSIRTRMPHASIGSDVMAGFPGETDADHAINMRDLAEAGLTALHVFPYSDRPGTVSSRMSQKVAGGVTRERARALRMVSADLARRFRESLVGTVRRMLTVDTGTVAVTDNYLKVRIPAGHERNQWIAVRIDAVDPVTTGGVIGEGVHPLTAVP